MRIPILLLFIFCHITTFAQNKLEIYIFDQDSRQPLEGATAITHLGKGAIADKNGLIIISIANSDSLELTLSFVGYTSVQKTFYSPFPTQKIEIALSPSTSLEEIVVTSTRNTRAIKDIPTRIEVIASEELAEKAMMRSNNIAMVLRESNGIQMQQTSASSRNQSIRIQGLDGRYTQLLKDGFPLYSGFSGGLSIMQIPPLDLKQVEIIKGSASTLYGGGAIAGLVNLISHKPTAQPKLKFMFDQTLTKGTTLSGFYAKKYNKIGTSLYCVVNRQDPYDANKDAFSDIPKIRSFSINPSFSYDLGKRSVLRLNINTTFEDRLGGDMRKILDNTSGPFPFTEDNNSVRRSYQLSYHYPINAQNELTIKNSLSYFNRNTDEPNYTFSGKQYASYSEIAYRHNRDIFSTLFGINFYSDVFHEDAIPENKRDYSLFTTGAFLQHNIKFSEQYIFETGVRIDYNPLHGLYPLPRVSLLLQPFPHWTFRIGGGMGYKLPTIFTEEAENITYQNIYPIEPGFNRAEKSKGANIDVNYKHLLGQHITFSVNQLFFFTRLHNALMLQPAALDDYFFINATAPIESRGTETHIQLRYNHFKWFINYSFASTHLKPENIQKPLTPKHRIGSVLMFEVEDKWRIGYEAYYTGTQYKSDLSRTEDYWVMGFMLMRKIHPVSVYINFENLTDTRIHNLENFIITQHYKPSTPQLWAPTDGRIINLGIILTLGDEF